MDTLPRLHWMGTSIVWPPDNDQIVMKNYHGILPRVQFSAECKPPAPAWNSRLVFSERGESG